MKVRLGFVNSAEQQKGVDSLIVTDMISPARNRAMADCVLLSGDDTCRTEVVAHQSDAFSRNVNTLIRPKGRPPSSFRRRAA